MNPRHYKQQKPQSGPSPPNDPFDEWLNMVRTLVVKPLWGLIQASWRLVVSNRHKNNGECSSWRRRDPSHPRRSQRP